MDTAKFRRFTDALVIAAAATPLVVSRHEHYHIDPEQPRQPGSLWATTLSGTGTGTLSAMGVSASAGTFDLRAG
jgi:hypothetical protein